MIHFLKKIFKRKQRRIMLVNIPGFGDIIQLGSCPIHFNDIKFIKNGLFVLDECKNIRRYACGRSFIIQENTNWMCLDGFYGYQELIDRFATSTRASKTDRAYLIKILDRENPVGLDTIPLMANAGLKGLVLYGDLSLLGEGDNIIIADAIRLGIFIVGVEDEFVK